MLLDYDYFYLFEATVVLTLLAMVADFFFVAAKGKGRQGSLKACNYCY